MEKVTDFIKEAVNEFKRVHWPTKKETKRLTLYVIGVSLGVGLFVMTIDYLFKEALAALLAK
ncbi:preprotein translocase subunit SecE [bacterium]|nr:preprotein translocase subunit SecE [bacterium]